MGAVSPGLGRKKDGTETPRPHAAEGQVIQEAGPRQEVFRGGDGVEMMADVQHTPEQRRVIAEYKAAVDPGLLDFANRAIAGNGQKGASYGIAPVTERAARDIKSLTGADVSGTVHDIQYDNVVHINKRHGKSGKADRSMANAEDIARAGYVLSNYDFAEPGRSNGKYLNKDGTHARTVLFKKAIDGVFCIVEAVPDTGKNKVHVISMWIGNNKADVPTLTDRNVPPGLDVQDGYGMSASDSSSYGRTSDVDQFSPRDDSPSGLNGIIEERLSNNSDNVNVEALSSASRAGFEPRMPEGTLDSKRKISEIRSIIEDAVGIPVRERQVRVKNTLGYIDHLHEVIRSKSYNDVSTLLHEFGHAVDKRFKLSESFPKYAGNVKLFL